MRIFGRPSARRRPVLTPRDSRPAPREDDPIRDRTWWILIALVTVLPRVAALPQVRIDRLTPDGARFLNLARCIRRGEGFSTPEAWPAWMNPARLPMPETFKEPGYPYAIAAATPIAGDGFRAGQWISLIAGLLIPFVVFALGRRIDPDPAVGGFAGLLAAASPVLIAQSVYVMAESAFVLALTAAFLAAAPRAGPAGSDARPAAAGIGDLIAGILFGLAFLVRAQALVALPALALLLLEARTWTSRLGRAGLAALGAAVAVAPYVARNLRVFGTPLHSDVAAFGLWPYVDQFRFIHSLERPAAAGAFALAHLPRIGLHALRGLFSFGRYTLPGDLLGHWVWLAPLAIGVVVTLRRPAWRWMHLFLVLSAGFMLSLYWVARYFASVTPLLCLFVAGGVCWLWRRYAPARAIGQLNARRVLLPVALAIFAYQAIRADLYVTPTFTPELGAARAEAPFLIAHLEPGEAVMAEITSYWAWFADRPAVCPVVADETRFEEIVNRLHVRYVALPSSRLAEFAARYPERRLPRALVRHHVDVEHDVTVFEVRAGN